MSKLDVLGIKFDRYDMTGATKFVIDKIEKNEKVFVVTPNSEIAYAAMKDKNMRDVINSADLVIPDGIGIVLASKILGEPLSERVPGIDLMTNMLQYAHLHRLSIYLLGAKEPIAKLAGENIKEKFPNITVAGSHNGYFRGAHVGEKGHSEEKEIIDEINRLKPDMLFIGLGAPKQEIFIKENMDIIDSKLFIGIGGALDVYSGKVKRAPKIYQKLGLEWFYRLLKEPSRIGRIMQLPMFLIEVIKSKYKR